MNLTIVVWDELNLDNVIIIYLKFYIIFRII